MKLRLIVLILSLALIVLWVYFQESYRLGREAKAKLQAGQFEEAFILATEALQKDPYNRQAFSVQNNAKQRQNIKDFLNTTEENFKIANGILAGGKITPQEFLHLSWIVEEFSRSYRNLLLLNAPNKQESEALENYASWFNKLDSRLKEAKEVKN